jgi:hypothetical protein
MLIMQKIELPIIKEDFTNDYHISDEPEKMDKPNLKNKQPDAIPIVINLSQPWNPRIQLRLKAIGEKSMGYRWMNDQEVTYNEGWYTFYIRLETILFTMITTISSGEFITLLFEANYMILIIISILEIMCLFSYGVTQSLKENGDYLEKSKYFSKNAAKFNEIYLSIQNQLSIPVDRREEDVNYLFEMTRNFNELMFSHIKPRQTTVDKYIEKSKNADIYKPLLVGGLDKIDIVIDKDSNTLKMVHQKSSTHLQSNTKINDKLDHEINRWLAHV